MWTGLADGTTYTLRQTGVAHGYWIDENEYQVHVTDGVVTTDLPTSKHRAATDVHEVLFANEVNGVVFRKFA